MTTERHSEFLPRGGCARAFVGCVAFPPFIIFLGALIAFPTVYLPWPPKDVTTALTLFAICELLAAGCLFTFFAMWWAVAAPQWLGRLLESGSTRLIALTGGFMLNTGVGLIGAGISYQLAAPFIVGVVGTAIGGYWIWAVTRRAPS